jgi:membrane protease YdiL (CAAX protease family)
MSNRLQNRRSKNVIMDHYKISSPTAATDPGAPTAPDSAALRPGSRTARWRKALAGIPSDYWIFLAYLAAVTAAEAITALSIPQVGMALHGLLLAAIILHAALFAQSIRQRLLITLALAPLIRLMSLSLPLLSFPLISWYAVIGAPLFVAAFLVYRFIRTGPARLQWSWRSLPLQILIGLSGVGLAFLENRILRPVPLISSLTWAKVWLPALILVIFTGLLEEVIFRGLILRSAIESLGRYGMLYSALLFAVLHLGYRSILDLIFVFGVAMYFGWVVLRTRSILGVTIAHGLTNVGLYLVIPFLLQTSSPVVTAPWVRIIPTAQRIVIATPTFTATPKSPPPASPTPTPTLAPAGSLHSTKELPKPSITPTSSSQPGENIPTTTPVWTITGTPSTPISPTTTVLPTSVPPDTPVPLDTPTPVQPTSVPPDTPAPPTSVPPTSVPPTSVPPDTPTPILIP